MNLKDDIEIDATASDKASSIQIELEQNRKNGRNVLTGLHSLALQML